MKLRNALLLGAAVCVCLVLAAGTAFAQESEGCTFKYKAGKGFTWESPDKKYNFQLCGRIKWGWQATDLDKDKPLAANSSGFGYSLVYLFLRGKLGDEVSYLINYRLEQATSMNKLDDCVVTWKPKQANGHASAWAGRFKVNFSREFYVGSGAMMLPGKSIANTAFNMGRDHGVVAKFNADKDLVAVMLGAFNGGGGTGDNVYSKALRIEFNPFGPVGYIQSDYAMSEKPLLQLGIGYAVDPNIRDDDGDGKVDDDDLKTVVDVAFFYKGLNLNLSLYQMTETEGLNPGLPTEDDLKSNGWSLYGGYFIKPKKLELVGMLAFIDQNEETNHDWLYEGRIGFNYYINGHNLKIQLDTGTLQTRLAQGKFVDLQTRILLQAQF